MKDIYLDNITTTSTDSRVVEAMIPYFTENFGNPLSRHKWGAEAGIAVEQSRQMVAELIGAKADEIIFTSTGSESNNLALKGITKAYRKKGNHLIVSGLEHESVLFSAKSLEDEGYNITYLPFDKYGLTNPNDVIKSIQKETILVTIIQANSEIGSIQPVSEIGKLCREKNILLFSDGIGTVGTIPVNVNDLHVDLLSFSSNMFYGPKGVAGLYIRQGTRLKNILDGGRQEKYYRPGTHNVPGIVGLGKAAELAKMEMKKRLTHSQKLRDMLWKGISEKIERIYLTGHPENRLPNHLSFCLEYIDGEALLMLLELEAGLAGSSGSICGEDTNQTSRILLNMGIPEDLARGAIRFTIGKDNTENEINYVIKYIPPLVGRLRNKSKGYQQLHHK